MQKIEIGIKFVNLSVCCAFSQKKQQRNRRKLKNYRYIRSRIVLIVLSKESSSSTIRL